MPVLGTRGDDPAAVGAVLRLIDRLGFDPVDAGTHGNSQVLEPDGSPFATTLAALHSLFSSRIPCIFLDCRMDISGHREPRWDPICFQA